MSSVLSPDVRIALESAEFAGRSLRLARQLDRKLYEQVAKVIEAVGGKWNRKAAAHVFPGDACEAIEPILSTGVVVDAKRLYGQFFTPPDLAQRIVERAGIEPGMSVLEPSAGRGALAKAAAAAGGAVLCVEQDENLVRSLVLAKEAFKLRHGDFLYYGPDQLGMFDRIVMNPPFARQADIDHVEHALYFLKPGGVLVAVMASGVKFRMNLLAVRFRAKIEAMALDGVPVIEDLPEKSFQVSGTNVNTVLVTVRKPLA